MYPDDTETGLVVPLPDDLMDGHDATGAPKPSVDAVLLANQFVGVIRAIITELGADPSGSSATVAERFGGLVDTVNGGTVSGDIVFATGATAVLGADASAPLEAVTLQQFLARVAEIMPGGAPSGIPQDGDTFVSGGPGQPFVWAPSGL